VPRPSWPVNSKRTGFGREKMAPRYERRSPARHVRFAGSSPADQAAPKITLTLWGRQRANPFARTAS
jgi:hypothetical protein